MLEPTIGTSRCGEVFVTNNADKWIYMCSYCQKATNDIGVFICHIRFDHLNGLSTSYTPVSITSIPVPMTSLPVPLTSIPEEEQKKGGNLILENKHSLNSGTICSKVSKIEDISLLTDNNRTENLTSDKDSITSSNSENMDITRNDSKPNKDSIVIKSENNDLTINCSNSLNKNDDNDDDDDDDALNKDDTDSEFMDEANDDMVASSSATNSAHQCTLCTKLLKSQQGLVQHMVLSHDKNYHSRFPFKCRHCNRGFQTRSGLCFHEKTHDKTKKFSCPLCELSYFRENDFIAHVMTHETALCFPCQVCGKIFPNNDERETHYKIHIKERPYGCDFCSRRFYQKHILFHHLKTHGLYKCNLCSKYFKSKGKPPRPCNCPDCKYNSNLNQLPPNPKFR